MKYKGYRILANANRSVFFEINNDGATEFKQVEGIQYQSFDFDSELWYSVIDKDNWVTQSFETIEEAKQYIREEL